MIRGSVNCDREPVVSIRVRGPGGTSASVDVVVDTGFTGLLILPIDVVTSLGLNWTSGGTAILADGSTCQTDYYSVEVEFGTTWQPVLAMTLGPESLLGMQFLDGCRLTVDGWPGGIVEISPVANRPSP